jgi:hypothetical protein
MLMDPRTAMRGAEAVVAWNSGMISVSKKVQKEFKIQGAWS